MGVRFSQEFYEKQPSEFLEELANWACTHSLRTDKALKAQHLQRLHLFGDALYLAYEPCFDGTTLYYRHYFITDLIYVMEFSQKGLRIHRSSKPKESFNVEKRFQRTADVIGRMQQVCGARGHSFCLRNSEQLSRYVQCGSWVSMQMLPRGLLAEAFGARMPAAVKALINHPPVELTWKPSAQPSYPPAKYSGFVEYSHTRDSLAVNDEKAYNIVLVGPTGVGKSRISNVIFNQNLCKVSPSARSSTRSMVINSGVCLMPTLSNSLEERRVNIIDTIGLCDSELSPETVLSIIKEYIQVNCIYIDRVVVVCAGRVEAAHSEGIRQVLEWFRYASGENHGNFVFLYNKADLLPEHLRAVCVADMCTLLGIRHESVLVPAHCQLPSETLATGGAAEEAMAAAGGDEPLPVPQHRREARSLPNAMATGFPEGGDFDLVRDDVHSLLDSVFVPLACNGAPSRPLRLALNESWCSIL